MAKVKGIKKLNKTISAIFEPFGIASASLSDEYAYYFGHETITYKLTQDTYEDDWFTEFIKERFNYECEAPFILSLLHEVGHHKTSMDISDMVFTFCDSEKERISENLKNLSNSEVAEDEILTQAKILNYQYFNLPDEIMATQWAVKYAKKHPKKVKKMWEEALAAIHEFYRKNNISA